MNKALGLSVILVLFSLNGWAQDSDYDKRNTHIFCSSHLAVISGSLNEQKDQRQALASLSRMHRSAAKTLGATKQHFDDVAGYLKNVRSDDDAKWNMLSAQSRKVCLPKSD